jgi:hypothetical protein
MNIKSSYLITLLAILNISLILSSCSNNLPTDQRTASNTANRTTSSSKPNKSNSSSTERDKTSNTSTKPVIQNNVNSATTLARSDASTDRKKEYKTVNSIEDEFNSVVSIRHGVIILGTGVAIRRDENTLYVLTANHVVQYPSGDPLEIHLQDRLIGSISEENYESQASLSRDIEKEKGSNKNIQRTDDLALLKISIVDKNLDIPISEIGKVKDRENTHLVGYITCDEQKTKLQISKGNITSFKPSGIRNALSAQEGNQYKYDLTYTNNTVGGMSGGPIYNDRYQVVGLHAGISFESILKREKYDTKKCKGLPVNPSKNYTENMGTSSDKIVDFLEKSLP